MTENNISYDGIFKELFDRLPDDNIVELINDLFEKNYPIDSTVLKLLTESHFDKTERRSDILLRINDDMFHIEIQSSHDSAMALRIFEYGFRSALQHGQNVDSNVLELNFPKPLVFYLRTCSKTPQDLTIRIIIPDVTPIDFKVSAKYLKDYTLRRLLDKSVLIFSPYYSLAHEIPTSKEDLSKYNSDILYITEGIRLRRDKGEITGQFADLAVSALKSIFQNELLHSNLDETEVNKIMESIERKYNLEPLNWEAKGIAIGRMEGRNEGRTEGRNEGRIKTRFETAFKMLGKGFNHHDIMDITGLNETELSLLMEKRPEDIDDLVFNLMKDFRDDKN